MTRELRARASLSLMVVAAAESAISVAYPLSIGGGGMTTGLAARNAKRPRAKYRATKAPGMQIAQTDITRMADKKPEERTWDWKATARTAS
eukprot:scaffold245223_cov33-Tisochrysis_lutea.AAC.1